MNRKDLLKDIGYKLRKVRNNLNHSRPQMAARIGVVNSSYVRNENGQTCPDIISLRTLGKALDISLDWFICDKGPMYYKEKEEKPEKKPKEKIGEIQEEMKEVRAPAAEKEPGNETWPKEIRELLDHMERIPLLRYELLAYFYKFKEEHNKMVAEAMKGQVTRSIET